MLWSLIILIIPTQTIMTRLLRWNLLPTTLCRSYTTGFVKINCGCYRTCSCISLLSRFHIPTEQHLCTSYYKARELNKNKLIILNNPDRQTDCSRILEYTALACNASRGKTSSKRSIANVYRRNENGTFLGLSLYSARLVDIYPSQDLWLDFRLDWLRPYTIIMTFVVGCSICWVT